MLMREIALTNGGAAVVDDQDYAALAVVNWQRHPHGYAYRCERRRPAPARVVLMHREILCAPKGLSVDHIDGNPLNNTRANLRLATYSENGRNQRPQRRANKSSLFKGVYLNKKNGLWVARCGGRDRNRWLGSFATQEEAARAYDAAAKELYGEFARPNFGSAA